MTEGNPENQNEPTEVGSAALDAAPNQRMTPFQLKPLIAITGLIQRTNDGNAKYFTHRVGRLWDVDEGVSLDFIVDIERRFRRKKRSFGYFEDEQNDITRQIYAYSQNPEDTEHPFLELANRIVEGLANSATELGARPEAGGNIIIMHYLQGGEDRLGKLLIIHLDKKKMYDFHEDSLRPKTAEPIDTSSIKQAASIDLGSMVQQFPAVPEHPYMRLIEGNSTSRFFKLAIGCDECISKKDSAKVVSDALETFMSQKRLSLRLKTELRDGLKQLYKDYSKPNSTPLSVNLIERKIDSILPDDSPHLGLFTAFINDNDYEINPWFSPSNFDVKNADIMEIADPNQGFKISVSRNQIGDENSGKLVTVTRDGNFLKFPISLDQREEIKKVLGIEDEEL